MNSPLTRFGLAGGLLLFTVCSLQAQNPPSPQPSTPPTQPSPNRSPVGPSTQTQPSRQPQIPLYIEGRVVNEFGQVPDQPVPVKLSCGIRTVQTIRTDIRGNFRFALGAGTQANFDYSAAEEAPSSSTFSGMNIPGEYSGFGTGSGSLAGCDVRISIPGYVPLDFPITDPASLSIIDVGVLELRRIGAMPTGTVSATSLAVPDNARKEYEQGVKDLNSDRIPQATQHLERAVNAYDQYAAAWTELGRAYAANREIDKAQQAYAKAIAADPKFTPPYLGLGSVQLQKLDYEAALESVGKAVEMNPALTAGVGGYIQGVSYFRLNQQDAAMESLLQAQQGPHRTFPQLHVILVELYLRRQDTTNAAAHMRAYIKEAPKGSFAPEMRTRLAVIDETASNEAGADRPATAP